MIPLPYPSNNLYSVSLVGPGDHGVIVVFNAWAIANWTSVKLTLD
jgi:hypothetical protein